MKRWAILLVAFFAMAAVAVALYGCSGNDDDDDDSGPSYGEDIQGTFPVEMAVEEDTCDEENVGYTESWLIEIEQSKNLGSATVYWKQEGLGNEKYVLFKGRVYGTVVIVAEVVEEPIGDSNCVKFTVQDYNIKVDLESGTLTGRLSDDIFYEGAGCDSSQLDCRQIRALSPATSD